MQAFSHAPLHAPGGVFHKVALATPPPAAAEDEGACFSFGGLGDEHDP